MQTVLKGRSTEVMIDTDGPVVIIGESINPTRRKKLVETLKAVDFSYVLQLAGSQIKAGADVLDVNVGFPGVDDERLLPETVKVIQEAYDIPLCLDSPNPKAIESVTCHRKRLSSVMDQSWKRFWRVRSRSLN